MAFPLALVASIISGIAPTIAQGLLIKGTIGDKAKAIIEGFIGKLTRPENEELEYSLKKLELEQVIELQRLDAEFKLEMERYKFELDKLVVKSQIGLIQADSRSLSWARKWWRPFCAWTLGITLFFFYPVPLIIQEVLRLLVLWDVLSIDKVGEWSSLAPIIDINTILGLIVPLLGLGAYRSFEKFNNKE